MSISAVSTSSVSKSPMPPHPLNVKNVFVKPQKSDQTWYPVWKKNPLEALKLSDKDNQHMKDRYFKKVTKGILPVEEGRKASYHIVSALPAAGKSTMMRALQRTDPNIIPLERDDLIMLHPHVNIAKTKDAAKWARHLRKIEGLDSYADGPMLDRFMKKNYHIAQAVVKNIDSHIKKAQNYNYNPNVHLVLAPIRTVKLRAMQRFLTAAPDSGNKRLMFSSQYDHPKEGYQALQKKYVKNLFDKMPHQPIAILFETAESDKKKEVIIHSYEEYEKMLEKVNKLPESKEARHKFNEKVRHLRQMFLEQYPKETENMPEYYRREALKLLKEMPQVT